MVPMLKKNGWLTPGINLLPTLVNLSSFRLFSLVNKYQDDEQLTRLQTLSLVGPFVSHPPGQLCPESTAPV